MFSFIFLILILILVLVLAIIGHPWISVDGVAPDKPLDPAVLSHLTRFSAMNKLKKMALRVRVFKSKWQFIVGFEQWFLLFLLQVIATKLSEEEIAGLKQMFKMIDTDNSGYITFEELKVGLRNFGTNLEESEIYQLMKSVSIIFNHFNNRI